MNTSEDPSVNGGKRTSLTMRMKPALQNARLRTKLTNAPLVIALTILVVLMTVIVSACYDNTQEANQHSTVMPTSELGSATKGDSELDKPTPEAITPEPTETPIPNDWYVDERGHIPTSVELLMPADSQFDCTYCITRTEDGELVCQMWTKGELQKE